ncbi:Hepatocyte growth factor-regulated tyrosine kinase substrate [Oopsacas minuta]|uniref:Hepatocyte growth factor-regulated tyrosine kinase substrate n=1 Tax=Oopsacas minuta TaxID=111878 RepID=A0AAV7JAT5_9METZ|nr:Hepatocyte growth factor-regulated tyrosine kinase substrate [Oopsacas minuta]
MLLDRATNSNNLDPDLTAIMEMCDTVRQGDITPKRGMVAVKRKLMDKHVLVSYYTLYVLEALMKNCGPDMHKEILVKEILGRMQDMVKDPASFSEKSKDKSLELIQTWNVAFRQDNSYLILTSVYNQLAMAGVRFPEINTSDAVFITERPPEWKADRDSKDCTLCHTEFSLVTRRHHCRNCGECFCSKCCSNVATLPKFGIEREVRVCESCFINLSQTSSVRLDPTNPPPNGSDLPEEYLKSDLFRENQTPAALDPKREAELKEQEELDLVIAMSLNEQENKPQKRVTFAPPTPEPSAPVSNLSPYSQLLSNRSLPTPPPDTAPFVSYPSTSADTAEDELAKYYNREYWEERKEQQHSSPQPTRKQPSPLYAQIQFPAKQQHKQEQDEYEGDLVLADSLKKNLDLFTNLLTDTQTQGRSPATDSSVQSLYGTLNAMHPELLRVMEEVEKKKEGYEGLEQKASMVKEARACLNKSRREYLDAVRQQEEQQRLLATMLLEQNIALIRKHQSEQVDMGVRLAEERERELKEEEDRKTEEQRRRRQQVNEYQRLQEQQVVAQHLAQIIPGKFEGAPIIGGYSTPPMGTYPPAIPPHMLQDLPPPGSFYPPPANIVSGPSSLPSSLNQTAPPSLPLAPQVTPQKPNDPFSPLHSSQVLQDSALNFNPQYAAIQTALQGPSSLPNLVSNPPPATVQLSNLTLQALTANQHPNPLAHMINAPQPVQQAPQLQIPIQSYPPPAPQVNQINLIRPTYTPQIATYQQSASPTPKEQSLIDFD